MSCAFERRRNRKPLQDALLYEAGREDERRAKRKGARK